MPSHRPNDPSDHETDFFAFSDRLLAGQAAALVIFSSWALGGNSDWAQSWIFVITLTGIAVLALRRRERHRLSLLPFLPPLLWLAFAGLALLNPSHTHSGNGGWLPREGWIRWLPTTADTGRTATDARFWFCALLEGALVWEILRSVRTARWLRSAIALNGFALAAIGAGFHFTGADQVLGFVDPPEPTYFFATFFYKNHWAAYGALGALASLGLALESWPAALAGHPGERGKFLLFGGTGLMTLVTLPLPGSRAGALLAVAFTLGFCALLFWVWWRTPTARHRRHLWILAAGGSLAAILAFGAVAYTPRARIDFARTQSQLKGVIEGGGDVRMAVSRDTWRMAQERPWFGWGPGCFEVVFPVFQGAYLRDARGRSWARFEYAHNDWLQQVAENGFLGAAILIVPAVFAVWRAWRRTGLAGRSTLGGCAAIALYAWIDFPFHNAAVLLLWTVMLAIVPKMPASPHRS